MALRQDLSLLNRRAEYTKNYAPLAPTPVGVGMTNKVQDVYQAKIQPKLGGFTSKVLANFFPNVTGGTPEQYQANKAIQNKINTFQPLNPAEAQMFKSKNFNAMQGLMMGSISKAPKLGSRADLAMLRKSVDKENPLQVLQGATTNYQKPITTLKGMLGSLNAQKKTVPNWFSDPKVSKQALKDIHKQINEVTRLMHRITFRPKV